MCSMWTHKAQRESRLWDSPVCFALNFKEKKIKYIILVQIILNTLLQKISSAVLRDYIQITN